MSHRAVACFVALAAVASATSTGCTGEAEPTDEAVSEGKLTGDAQVISFPGGRDSVTVSSPYGVRKGQQYAYSVTASEGQVLDLYVSGSASTFELRDPAGRTIGKSGIEELVIVAPKTGTYSVVVTAMSGGRSNIGADLRTASFLLDVAVKAPTANVPPTGRKSISLGWASVPGRNDRQAGVWPAVYFTYAAQPGQRVSFATGGGTGRRLVYHAYDSRGTVVWGWQAEDQPSGDRYRTSKSDPITLPSDGNLLIKVALGDSSYPWTERFVTTAELE